MKRVGIIGGTFDPLHIAHLIVGQEAAVSLALEKIVFIPNRRPPHKHGPFITPSEDRYRMTVLGTEDNPLFDVSRIELDRAGPSYTIDTVLEIKATLSRQAGIYLIMGMDSLLDLENWKAPEALVREVTFAVAPRPGCSPHTVPEQFREHTVFLPVPLIDLSSSFIRKRVSEGKSIRYLVPPAVENYILTKKLYCSPAP